MPPPPRQPPRDSGGDTSPRTSGDAHRSVVVAAVLVGDRAVLLVNDSAAAPDACPSLDGDRKPLANVVPV